MKTVPDVTVRAALAASERLRVITAHRRPRTGRKTAMAIEALKRLRRDILIGVPPESLVDRIDDELFKLEKS